MSKVLSAEKQAKIQKAAKKAELQRMSPVQRAATKLATKTGQPVSYIGGSSKVGVSKGLANPMPNIAAPAAPAPAPTPTAPTQQNNYNPTPLVPESQQQQPYLNIMMPEMPEAPPPQYSAGGIGADVGTNAAGFRRKKSSARMAGLTSKGTSQFKIGGQSARSSGLNIGI